MRRLFTALLATLLTLAGVTAGALTSSPAASADIPIGRLGDTLRVEFKNVIADITVLSIEPSEIPPGWGYPPRPPRQEVWKAKIAVQAVKVPNAHQMASTFIFNGVSTSGDAYQPRNTDSPDALQYALLNAPSGSAVGGFVFWDPYRDLVSNVVLTDKWSGIRLAQWNV